MKQQAMKHSSTRLAPSQKNPGSRLWDLLGYLALFILLDLVLMQGPSTLISNVMHATFSNGSSLPTGQQLMPSLPAPNADSDAYYHGLLNYVSLNGLCTTLLAIIEWRIGENLLKSTCELLREPARKLLNYGRRKIRLLKLTIHLAYLGFKNSKPVM